MNSDHSQDAKSSCNKCSNTATEIPDMSVHMEDSHSITPSETNKISLEIITEQLFSLRDEVLTLKKEFSDTVNTAFNRYESLLESGMTKIINDSNQKYEKLSDLTMRVKGKVNHVGKRIVENLDITNQPIILNKTIDTEAATDVTEIATETVNSSHTILPPTVVINDATNK